MRATTQSCHQRHHAADVIFHHDHSAAPSPGRAPSRTSLPPETGRACTTADHPASDRDSGAGLVPQPDGDMGAITDLTGTDLETLGLPEGKALPSESNILRVLQSPNRADVEPAWPHDSIRARIP